MVPVKIEANPIERRTLSAVTEKIIIATNPKVIQAYQVGQVTICNSNKFIFDFTYSKKQS
tara:strand:- start:2004 stop:2183 length:180 start_codon:yes stop_codon:yes gene_type:complete